MTKLLSCRLALALGPMILVAFLIVPATTMSSASAKEGQGKLRFSFFIFKAPEKRSGIGRYTMYMKKPLRCRYLEPAKDRSLKLLFDNGRDGDFDLKGKFVCTEGRLLLFLRGTQTHNRYEPIRPERLSPSDLRVGIPLDLAELKGWKYPTSVARSRDAPLTRMQRAVLGSSEPLLDSPRHRADGFRNPPLKAPGSPHIRTIKAPRPVPSNLHETRPSTLTLPVRV